MGNENKYYSLIEGIVGYIEEHIKEDISLDILSEQFFISKFHLHRLFRALTGKTLMHYVIARKLACSIEKLLYTKLRIIDIAQEYSFEYEQNYIRAFKQEYDITPDAFRRGNCFIQITEPVDLTQITAINEDLILFSPLIQMKPGFYLEGIKHKFDERKITNPLFYTQLAMEFIKNKGKDITYVNDHPIYFGYIEADPEDELCGCYMTSYEVTEAEAKKTSKDIAYIPPQKYVVFKYSGMHGADKIKSKDIDCLNEIIVEWLEKSAYTHIGETHFERVDSRVCSDNYCELELFVPIQNKIEAASE